MNIMVECLTPVSLISNAFHADPQCVELYQTAMATDAGGFAEYLPVFLLTCGLEFPIYFFFTYRESSVRRVILISILLNLITHPIVYLGMPILFEKWNFNYLQYLVIAEIFAPLVEAICLRKIFHTSWKTSVWAAIMANLFSWTIGVYWNS